MQLIEHFVSGSTARSGALLVGVNKSTAGKVPVFGLLKRGGKVYTKIISDASSTTLMPIIERKVIPDSIVYTECWKGDNALEMTQFKHYRINHSQLFANKTNHINGIEKLLVTSKASYA